MKKYLYIALIMVCGLASCDVLDTEPMDSYNELLIWRNKDLAENVLREAYWTILKDLYCSGDNNTECCVQIRGQIMFGIRITTL